MVAFLIGVSPFLGVVPSAVIVAILIGYLITHAGVSEDTSIGILFAGLFALGLIMLTAARGLPVNLEDILLGQVLGVSSADVFVTFTIAAGVLAIMYTLHKELVFATFDPTGASVIGLPTDGWTTPCSSCWRWSSPSLFRRSALCWSYPCS